MPRTPKHDPPCEQEPAEDVDGDKWSEDQKRRQYYYDDAHGYEVYVPEEEEKEEAD